MNPSTTDEQISAFLGAIIALVKLVADSGLLVPALAVVGAVSITMHAFQLVRVYARMFITMTILSTVVGFIALRREDVVETIRDLLKAFAGGSG